MVTRSLTELAAELKGQVLGDGSIVVSDVAGIREALPGDITFIANARYDSYLLETRASYGLESEFALCCGAVELA